MDKYSSWTVYSNVKTKSEALKLAKKMEKRFFGYFTFWILGGTGNYTVNAKVVGEYDFVPKVLTYDDTYVSTSKMSPSEIRELVVQMINDFAKTGETLCPSHLKNK